MPSVGWRATAPCASTPRKLSWSQLVYVTDREGDIYEIFAEDASRQKPKADRLIRSQTDRNLVDGGKLWQRVGAAELLGEVEIDLPVSEDQGRATSCRPCA